MQIGFLALCLRFIDIMNGYLRHNIFRICFLEPIVVEPKLLTSANKPEPDQCTASDGLLMEILSLFNIIC